MDAIDQVAIGHTDLPHLPLLEDCFHNLLINFSTLAAREKFTGKIFP